MRDYLPEASVRQWLSEGHFKSDDIFTRGKKRGEDLGQIETLSGIAPPAKKLRFLPNEEGIHYILLYKYRVENNSVEIRDYQFWNAFLLFLS